MMTMALLCAFMLPAQAGELHAALAVHQLETDIGDHIQKGLLDPILGPGEASAFVTASLQEKSEREASQRSGTGSVLKQPGADAPAVRKGVRASSAAFTRDEQRQEARQTKESEEARSTAELRLTRLEVLIVHDAQVPAERLGVARQAVLEAFKGESAIRPEDVRFLAVDFAASWRRRAP